MTTENILALVRAANPGRDIANAERRQLKLGEEYGEANQALVAVTSRRNRKNKSWADYREELTDVAIIALDILLSTFPDEPDLSDEEIEKRILVEFQRKLNKWQSKMDTQAEPDDAE